MLRVRCATKSVVIERLRVRMLLRAIYEFTLRGYALHIIYDYIIQCKNPYIIIL